jgi:hypothetical protein
MKQLLVNLLSLNNIYSIFYGYAVRFARFPRAISWTSSSEMSIHSESSSNRTYFGDLLAVGAEIEGWVYSNFPPLEHVDSDAWLTSSCDTLDALSVAVFSLLNTLAPVTEVLFLPTFGDPLNVFFGVRLGCNKFL